MDKLNVRLLVAAVVVLVGLVGFLGGYLLGSQARVSAPIAHLSAHAAGTTPAVSLPPELVSFLAGWKCPCGDCKDLLVDCNCDKSGGAAEIKKFVLELHKGKTPLAEIRDKVIKRYGQSVTGSM